MSGHSKWATIKRAKEANDAKKSSVFSKISKDIIIAARLGQTGDLNLNPILRVAVTKARSANMPNDKIEKAINKGLGIVEPGEVSYEKTYEAYGIGSVPMLIDVETDNPNRALTDVRTIINKAGGKMVPEGSISWQFKEYGFINASIKINNTNDLEDNYILPVIGIDGVEDVEYDFDQETSSLALQIYTKKDSLKSINESLKDIFNDKFNIDEITIIKNSHNLIDIDEDTKKRFLTMVDLLKEIDDVSNIWFSFKP